MSPVETLLEKLPGAKNTGTGWSARCPAHDDSRASLSVTEGNGGTALVKCHAGCDTSAVVQALGLELRDLFPPTEGIPHTNSKAKRQPQTFPTANEAVAKLERQHGKRSAMWTYHDAEGKPIGVVVRWDLGNAKKDIRPVSWAPDGWRIGALAAPRPLYRLPEIASAKRVVVGEGEKAADAARSIGFTATTSPGGSQAASKADWSPLADKEVWILPDNDAPGRKYAEAVSGILATLTPAPRVKIIELPDLPDAGDIVDWLAAKGGSPDPDTLRHEVEALAEATTGPAPPTEPNPTAGPSADDWPDPPAPEALHGLTGEFVRAVEPHTEADAAALLVSFLLAAGNLIGRTAYVVADGSRHYCNEFAVIVGKSAKARKGTSWNRVFEVLERAAGEWAAQRVKSGLSSGEGLIFNVRDPVEGQEAVREKGQPVHYETVVKDEGEADKRLLLVESEFANVLKHTDRQGNTLSATIRDAWDKGSLSPLTKNSPIKATNAHISIIGHITREELQRYLTATESANGFANRFMWVLARRSKLLPFGGAPTSRRWKLSPATSATPSPLPVALGK